ncbi:putative cytochrome P450 CYP13A10 [Liolophura sinensis]|uniref:putative cytochrome P450 CYP13A10 n=1 Tax=Liolophura sinensis TaxID=3198878 RepID=UPI0031594885
MRWLNQKYWQKVGVGGPDPNIFFGNLNELRTKTNYEVIQGWTKKYGKTYGYYCGEIPVLVTSDVKLIKEAFVEKHQHFHGRQPLPLPNSSDDSILAFTSGRTWKRQRAVVSPFFSSLMLKEVTPRIEKTVNHLLRLLSTQSNKGGSTEMLSVFQAFSLEAIARCAFSMESESQKNKNDLFLSVVRNFFKIGNFARRSFVLMVAAAFPSCRRLWNIPITLVKCLRLFTDPQDALMKVLLPVINERRTHKKGKKDLLQILVESEVSDTDRITPHSTDNESLDTLKVRVERKLNKEEVEAQTMLMLISSYETTANALAYIVYELAANLDVQSKLMDEIECTMERKISMASLNKLNYMELVIKEALRKNPFVVGVIARRCMSECTVGGIPIPKDALVAVDLWSLHFDKDYWGPIDTNILAPERFLDKEKEDVQRLAWLPFGIGPRKCIGSKLAMLQIKMVLVQLLQNFDIRLSSETKSPLPLYEAGLVEPRDGVKVNLSRKKLA